MTALHMQSDKCLEAAGTELCLVRAGIWNTWEFESQLA